MFPVQNDGGNGPVGAVQQQQQNTFRRGPADLRPSADSAAVASAANVASGSGGPKGSSTGSVMGNVEFHRDLLIKNEMCQNFIIDLQFLIYHHEIWSK